MPILFYYKVDRSITDIPRKSHEPKDISRFSTYSTGRNSGTLNFRDFFWWFKQQQNIERDEKTPNLQLDLVRKAIEKIVPGFSKPEVVNRGNRFLLYSDDRKKSIEIEELSDGQRTLITLVADIAKRGALALGEKPEIKLGDIFGVALIDEIELHLHPKWQSGIINDLQLAFPRLQIIATTHSPAVLTNVKDENSFLLKDGQLIIAKILRSHG